MTDRPYHILLDAYSKAASHTGASPVAFFILAPTAYAAIRAARMEAQGRGLVTTYVRAARIVPTPRDSALTQDGGEGASPV